MKNVLFATTAASALLIGGIASAQGVALFGDARLGLGYNINNEGGVIVDEDGNSPDDVRAVSRVRFGVNMTGETDSGITFGATIRADNAQGGQGGVEGMRDGSVFVSGSWGTLTFGDTNGADEQWVGDVPGNFSLTGLTDINETKYISNGGSFGNDTGNNFASNPFARPTVRYDFDIAGFGISLSSNRDLTDIGVGAGYAADFGGGSWNVGAGYFNFDSFTQLGDATTQEASVCLAGFDANGNCLAPETVILVPAVEDTTFFPNGEQWSVGLSGDYEAFSFGLTYVKINSNTSDSGDLSVDNILVGASFGFDAFEVGAFYGNVLNTDDNGSGVLDNIDGDSAGGITAQYDLGGGASINGGVAYTYGGVGVDGQDQATVADFGIKMAF
jgi:outer membrane protein OmpU